MKFTFLFLSAALALVTGAGATTILASGGLDGRQFGYATSLNSLDFTVFTNSGQSMATIEVGSIESGLFSVFAPSDSTPISFGAGIMAGRWLGDASTNDASADAFNGRQIWFSVTTTIGGQTYTGYFADSGLLFPQNDGGFSDDQSVASYNLDTISPMSTGDWSIDSANGRIVLIVPEPSAALLGAIGSLALLRRRR